MPKPVRSIQNLSKTSVSAAVKSAARVALRVALLATLFAGSATTRFAAAQDVWLMKGHDARRTGQSGSYGIRNVDTTRSWEYVADAAFELNVGASVTRDGVFFGSWGLLRSDSLGRDTRFWNKSDGKLYGLDLDSGAELWEPARLDTVNRCYDLPGRERTSTDLLFCGLLNNYHVTFYNGTVEGQPAIDTVRQAMYLGRGDGKLYAIDPATGMTKWRFETYNPQDVSDPDGGGEVIAAPLLAPDGSVYIGTWGEGPYETNAFYAVDPSGNERWRYPSDSSLGNRAFASPAMSPDAQTVYQATYFGEEASVPGVLYALDLTVDDNAPDGSRLKWSFPLEFNTEPVYATTMAVGSDGTVYVGGLFSDGPVNRPVLAAFSDEVAGVSLKWNPSFVRFDDGAQYVQGVALREPSGDTERLYVTTANAGTALFNAKEEGSLYAVDPVDGSVQFSYDPSDDVPSAVGGLTSPAISRDGIVYFGVRGRYGGDARDGYYFAVADADDRFEYLWSVRVDGHVEWAHPAIGPDGSIFGGSGVQDSNLRNPTYDEGVIPEGTSPKFYALKGATSTSVRQPGPVATVIEAPYPNPANGTVTLSVSSQVASQVVVGVFDVLGRRVLEMRRSVGVETLVLAIDLGSVPSGLYMMRATAGTHTSTFPVVVVK